MAVCLAAMIRLTNLWLNGRLAASIGSDLSIEAYRRILNQPYEWHINRNSSGVIAATTTHISQTVLVIALILQLANAALVAMSLFAALLFADWKVACTTALVFGTAYFVVVITIRKRLETNSAVIAKASHQQLKALQEGLGGIRDVLLDGSQAVHLNIYRLADSPLRLKEAQSSFLGAFPRYALEALGLVLIAVIALVLIYQRGNSVSVIPLLGTLALGAQRLLPALQQVFSSWALIRTYSVGVAQVLEILDQPIPKKALKHRQSPFGLEASLRLQNLCFRYTDLGPLVLNEVGLDVHKGERIGIVGSTGSGKSTLMDLLMGLLSPTSGQILLDGKDLHDLHHPERLRDWRSIIAHVPQSIYLADSSIGENIAFGVSKDQVDMAKVRKAAEQAQIAGFIESSDRGYNSFVGERGIRLSGGQRQRIGIARALYKQAQVLVFDEATSALDNETEAAVMSAIEGLSRHLTVVMIAHRLSTVERCDRVIKLDQGRVVLDGPPRLVLNTL